MIKKNVIPVGPSLSKFKSRLSGERNVYVSSNTFMCVLSARFVLLKSVRSVGLKRHSTLVLGLQKFITWLKRFSQKWRNNWDCPPTRNDSIRHFGKSPQTADVDVQVTKPSVGRRNHREKGGKCCTVRRMYLTMGDRCSLPLPCPHSVFLWAMTLTDQDDKSLPS